MKGGLGNGTCMDTKINNLASFNFLTFAASLI